MAGTEYLLFVTLVIVLFSLWEAYRLRKNLPRISIRIHVNGTRGKSSVTRLIAGALREKGIVTCAKTTGTLPRIIFPDGSEYPVFRPSGARLSEQARIISIAAGCHAQALVMECMALQPPLQWLSESKLIKATHGVITNARADHLDVMGPREKDVALALAGTTPVHGRLFTAEKKYLSVFDNACRDRRAQLITVGKDEVATIKDDEMARFSYMEHKENVALALKVCLDLGIDRETALKGMWKALPDPGATTISHIRFFGRHIYFVNGFSANDPESTERLWNMAIERFPEAEKRIFILNCRLDRPNRSEQFGELCVKWKPADHYILIGTGTYFFARSAISNGLPEGKLLFAENQSDSDLFETIVELSGKSSLVVGIVNIKGQGLSLARFFRNRSILKEAL
ncbi:MAG TPA: poly-gamma-glutamate synthase PgsB [Thermodesulfobacteriota bacterium]|nr:poly-gamma-glutamate synthase PgsB [Thermodesulfobacteriota bacterium]